MNLEQDIEQNLGRAAHGPTKGTHSSELQPCIVPMSPTMLSGIRHHLKLQLQFQSRAFWTGYKRSHFFLKRHKKSSKKKNICPISEWVEVPDKGAQVQHIMAFAYIHKQVVGGLRNTVYRPWRVPSWRKQNRRNRGSFPQCLMYRRNESEYIFNKTRKVRLPRSESKENKLKTKMTAFQMAV